MNSAAAAAASEHSSQHGDTATQPGAASAGALSSSHAKPNEVTGGWTMDGANR